MNIFTEKVKPIVRALHERAHFLWGHWRLAIAALVLLVAIWVFRPLWQPTVVIVRSHLFEGVLAIVTFLYLVRAAARRDWWPQFGLGVLAVTLWLVSIYGLNVSPYDYVSLWWRYRHVEKQDFAVLPETAHERIQPLASVRTLSNEVLSDTEFAAEPDVVRIGHDYRFTFAIEPSKDSTLRRWTEPVRSVVSLPVTSPSFDFSSKTREPVMFPTGEGLILSRSVASAVIRSFGLWRFLSCEPADVKYLKDDNGDWVQVVSLVRWRGFLAPWPEFGGVVLFRQRPDGFLATASRALFGSGEWIPPEDVPKRPFLVGQNLVPYDVSRYLAESFRFKSGFLAPAPGLHRGDIRVPHLEEDQNPQPYTIYATWDGEPAGKLWHYFGLEPFDKDKQGLSVSLFVPADGIGPVRVVHHGQEGLIGISAVPAKVRGSQKIFDWRGNAPVEHRPFIRTVNGSRRLMWLTTIVTFKKGNDGDFIAGADPEITLTDAATQHVVWVKAKDPASWLPQVERELRAATGEVAEPVLAPPGPVPAAPVPPVPAAPAASTAPEPTAAK